MMSTQTGAEIVQLSEVRHRIRMPQDEKTGTAALPAQGSIGTSAYLVDEKRGTDNLVSRSDVELVPANRIYREAGQIHSALRLLMYARQRTDEVIAALDEGRNFDADNQLMLLAKCLEELFCFRDELGDGFGLVTSSLQLSLQRMQADMPMREHAIALGRVIKDLLVEPAVLFENASKMVDRLAQAGLRPVPEGVETIEHVLLSRG